MLKFVTGAIFLMGTTAGAAVYEQSNAKTAKRWEREGRSLFVACEFRKATRAFEKALAEQPDSAALHYWLGKSYARLAEVSNPLSAPKHARKAQRNLEQAIMIDPRNEEYLQELFEFYVDSPEWFRGGLQRATNLLERVSDTETGDELRMKEIANSREEHSGAGWWLRRAILRTSGAVGELVPQPLP
jgi:tetratricopeptide (TPR) repeat protein